MGNLRRKTSMTKLPVPQAGSKKGASIGSHSLPTKSGIAFERLDVDFALVSDAFCGEKVPSSK
jgi:hypothetical protein